jgi:RNA polymerase sigma factor (TIGR02999 family)
MRCLLVDYARGRNYQKRGPGIEHVSLDEAVLVSQEQSAEVLALDAALKRLAVIDPRKSQIVELRYFGGLDVEEAAEAISVAPITVKREWLMAKAWLHRELSSGANNNDA